MDRETWRWLCECNRCECHRARSLMGRVGGRRVCPPCLLAHGLVTDDLDETHRLEERTRERMTARGGADRHRVRSGKS